MPVRPRKTFYYLRSLAAVSRIAEPRSLARFLARRSDLIVLRNGLRLRLGRPLDLLILKETVVDDSYRLRELDGTAPAAIVDVGASIGDFALWAGRRFPEATVLAFEPNPRWFALLAENVRANDATNVEARRVAVGTEDRLDELVPADRIDLLKIDCEGLELDVLESARALLPRVRRVALEYHRHLVPDADDRCRRVLAGHGFELSTVPDRYNPAIGYLYGRRA